MNSINLGAFTGFFHALNAQRFLCATSNFLMPHLIFNFWCGEKHVDLVIHSNQGLGITKLGEALRS